MIFSIAVGGWIFTMALYYLGRWRSEWVRNRFPKMRPVLLRVIRVVRRHPWRSSLVTRIAWGLRLTLPLACGVAHVPVVVYALGSAISSLVWSAFFTLLGWGFGETAQLVLLHVRRYEKWIVLVILVGVGIGFYFTRKRRPELTEEVVDVLSRGDENGPA